MFTSLKGWPRWELLPVSHSACSFILLDTTIWWPQEITLQPPSGVPTSRFRTALLNYCGLKLKAQSKVKLQPHCVYAISLHITDKVIIVLYTASSPVYMFFLFCGTVREIRRIREENRRVRHTGKTLQTRDIKLLLVHGSQHAKQFDLTFFTFF